MMKAPTLSPAQPLLAADSVPEDDIHALNKLLRGEISAVETYQQCIEKVEPPATATELERLQQSHAVRRDQLRTCISVLGGEPATDSGAWGAFARAVEGGAAMLGETPALKMLEQGELHGVRLYHDVGAVHPQTQAFIHAHLIPEQDRTQSTLASIAREHNA